MPDAVPTEGGEFSPNKNLVGRDMEVFIDEVRGNFLMRHYLGIEDSGGFDNRVKHTMQSYLYFRNPENSETGKQETSKLYNWLNANADKNHDYIREIQKKLLKEVGEPDEVIRGIPINELSEAQDGGSVYCSEEDCGEQYYAVKIQKSVKRQSGENVDIIVASSRLAHRLQVHPESVTPEEFQRILEIYKDNVEFKFKDQREAFFGGVGSVAKAKKTGRRIFLQVAEKAFKAAGLDYNEEELKNYANDLLVYDNEG